MIRFNRVVCALVVCSLVAIAYGKAIKVTSLTAVGESTSECPNADGMAILNYNAGQARTEVQLAITDFLPNTEYTADVVTIHGGPSLRFTTNARGNGQGHAIASADITDDGTACAEVTVYIDANNDFFPQDGEKRAVGNSCN